MHGKGWECFASLPYVFFVKLCAESEEITKYLKRNTGDVEVPIEHKTKSVFTLR